MQKTSIEWTETTVNPWVGCELVSDGCRECYARRLVEGRLKNLYPQGFDRQLYIHLERLDKIPRKGKSRMIFPCSLSDPFLESLGMATIEVLFQCIKETPQHTWQILTKRPQRMLAFYEWWEEKWPDNAWAGVSVENADYLWRLDELAQIPARVRFVSLEPLLGPVDLRPWLEAIGPNEYSVTRFHPYRVLNWIIIGGESGPNARPMKPEWVRDVVSQCREAQVPVFFKQYGEYAPAVDNGPLPANGVYVGLDGTVRDGDNWEEETDQAMLRVGKKAAGCLLDGEVIQEWPC